MMLQEVISPVNHFRFSGLLGTQCGFEGGHRMLFANPRLNRIVTYYQC